jgi:hypothetical protein
MSALFVTDVNVITNCPLAFAVTVNCCMLAMFSPPAVAKRARFERHRIEYEKVASSHEQRKNPKPRCLVTISSSSFADGCSGRDHSVRAFLNLPRNYLNDCYEPTITIYIVIETSYHCCNKVVCLREIRDEITPNVCQGPRRIQVIRGSFVPNLRAVIIIGEGALNRIGAATARRVAELGAGQRARDGVRLLLDGIICSFAANQN